MRCRPLLPLTVFALLALVPQAWAQADKVDEYVQAAMRKQKIPGLSIAVVRNGEVLKANANGKVTHLIFHQNGETEAKKIR
ncbi:MAG TPA: hypothetical protein VGM86_04055 [Thermoanaerobaculia bacterium]|jgi:CubicO group peptidase (beta-lactamase class C family)